MPNQGERFFADEGLGSVSATVGTLPVGCTLGEERVHQGVLYKLCYNAGTAAGTVGLVMSPVALANCTPASVAVSTLSNHGDHVGAVVVKNTSVSAGAYFWGAVKGQVALVAETASIPTGNLISIGNTGQVMIASVASSRMPVGYVISSISNGGTATGNAFVDFS